MQSTRSTSSTSSASALTGVALNPATPVSALAELVDDVDLVLCMTVNPGWGGQAFLPGSPAKLERLRALLGEGPAVEVDGGIAVDTARRCAASGASVFVAGTSVFGAPDPGAAVRALAEAVSGVRPAV
jgi:ribulose-phosphate 3-epimerase